MAHTQRTLRGADLQRLREDRRGWSQGDLARAVGVRREHVCRIEAGTVRASAALMVAIAEALGVDLDAFTERTPATPPAPDPTPPAEATEAA